MNLPAPEPAFEANRRHVINIAEILNNSEAKSAPSHLDEEVRAPLKPDVVTRDIDEEYTNFMVSEDGKEIGDEDIQLEGIELKAVSRRKHSRRYKAAPSKKNKGGN